MIGNIIGVIVVCGAVIVAFINVINREDDE